MKRTTFFIHFFGAILTFGISINLLAQTTFNYSGGTVSVDNTAGGAFEDALTIDVPVSSFPAGHALFDIDITIAYDKTDGNCASPGTGNSYHNEHGFQLESPSGTQITIFSTGTFAGATDISPGVSQVFDDESTTTIPGGIPANGTYIPENSFSGFDGEDPEGTWILRAAETGTGDSLCITGASITITARDANVTPGDVTGVALWLKADYGVASSSNSVSGWKNRSSAEISGAQATAGNRPTVNTNGINGYPAIGFDGNDYLDFGDTLDYRPGTDEWSFFTVYNVDNGNTGTFLARASGTGANRQYQYGVTGETTFQIIGGGGTEQGSADATGQWNVFSSITSTADVDTWLSGSADLVAGSIGTSFETQNLIVGARTGGSGFRLTGDISEIILIDNELTPSARRDVETYLAIKYGLTLDITTQSYTVGGTSIYNLANYASNIAGIGRDDSQELNHTSSQNSSELALEIGNATDLDDEEFLVWGNNSNSFNYTTSNIPAGVDLRLSKIWSIVETGDVGTVDVIFDLTTIGYLSGESYYLITADNTATMPADLATASVSGAGTITTVNGRDIVTFSGVNFGNNSFFTLGRTRSATIFPGDVNDDLTLWLKADIGTTLSGSDVTGWTDQSEYSNDATSPVEPTYETNILNGNPVLSFANDTYIGGTAGFYTNDYFVVTVPNEVYSNNSTVGVILSFEDTHFSHLGLGNVTDFANDEVVTHATGEFSTDYRRVAIDAENGYIDPVIINPKNNSQSSPTFQHIFSNGIRIDDSDVNLGSFENLSNREYRIGAHLGDPYYGSNSFNGKVAELISYSSALSDVDRRDVATYLAIKYGITLDITAQNYTVEGSSIYNYTAYNNDIAGIGVNTSSGLNQTASQSVNGGSIVKVSTASDLVDGEYLVWGNDGSANTFTTSNLVTGISERLNKIWRVSETGDVGTVTISFDLTSLGIDVSNTTINLIKAGSGSTMPTDLSTATLITGGTVSIVNGREIITFELVDFSNGEYFTIGGDVQSSAPGGVSAGLSLWLRGDDGITSSSNLISAWSDKSGNGNNLIQGNSSLSPTLVENSLNTHAILDFTNDNMDGATGFYTHDYFIVLSPDQNLTSASTVEYPLGFTNNGQTGLAFGAVSTQTNEVVSHITTDGSGNVYASGQLDNTVTYGGTQLFNSRVNAGNNGQELYANGGLLSTTELDAINFANISDKSIRLGNDFENNGDFDGKIAEVISYSARLTPAERRDVETYLAIRYGITLSLTSEAYTEGGSAIYNQTSYANDIAGIGKNLDNGLDQTSGISVNSGAMIAMENPTDLDNGEYVIWGNDGTSKAAVQTTELPAAYDERLSIEWIAETTGNPGNVTVKVYVGDITDYVSRGNGASLYTLLINSSSNFSTVSSATTASSMSGDTLSFENISFTGTSYFTLAIPQVASPGGIAGVELWLKANSGVQTTGTVTAVNNDGVGFWRDASGNGNDASEATNTPTFISDAINGNPVVRFNDLPLSLQGTITNNTGNFTFFVVGIDNDATTFNNDAFFEFRRGATDDRYWFEDSRHASTTNFGSSIAQSVTTLWSIDHPTGAVANIYENGSSFEASYATATYGNGGTGTYDYVLGDDDTGGNRLVGDIAELIVYTSTLNSTQRRDVDSYLAIKYGITLNISSQNYTSGGSSIYNMTSYANDIAGIGSDASLGLSQASSKSVNTGSIVSINDASSLSDGEYLVWGNDNTATTETTTGIPTGTGITHKMTRLWAIVETGDPGTVSVSFDLTGLGYGAKTAGDFTLIVDTNSDFTDGILHTYPAISFSSNIVTFTGADFTTASHFGLGTAVNIATDTDTDGIPDYFETAYGTNPSDGNSPVTGGSPNTDVSTTNGVLGDGISDALESILVSNGASGPITIFTDTDGDGIPDHIEVNNGTSPYSAAAPTTAGNSDSDGDGIPDALEALITSEGGAADPALNTDTDNDGIPDYYEVLNGTDPNNINSPTTNGGNDTDADNISDALEAILISGGASAPIDVSTDTDGDAIPDYIEALTFTDPFNINSPSAVGTPGLRSLQADYVVSGGSCVDISGYQWIDITDNLGNLVFSINPVGNDLGSTCWGIRILNGTTLVRDNGEDWILNRNWYITPTNQPSSNVYVRLYSLDTENTDLHSELINDGQNPGLLSNFNADSIKITKISGIEDLDPLVTGGTRTLINPLVSDYSTNGKSYTFGVNSFSSLGAHYNPGDPDSALPVELLGFYADVFDGNVELRWSTASEINNDYFIIERSSDGKHFNPLGRINGSGTTNIMTNYTLTDEFPMNGLAYYRLKQVDYDGTTTYSEILAVNYSTSAQILLYPNPAKNYTNIMIDQDINILDIQMVDQSGRIVKVDVERIDSIYKINTSNLVNGLYIVYINLGKQEIQYKLNVLR